MVRSIKRVPETPGDLVVNSKVSPGNDCTELRHLNVELKSIFIEIFYLGFLSRTFTIHRTTEKGGGSFLTPL